MAIQRRVLQILGSTARLAALLAASACSDTTVPPYTTDPTGTGGSADPTGTGGTGLTGGVGGSRGCVFGCGTGGSAGTGGMSGTGGSVGTGGMSGTGGSAGTGGVSGMGGSAGTGGEPGTGGSAGTGGVSGMGGSAGTGGVSGMGGSAGTGGVSGTGGAGTGLRDVFDPGEVYVAGTVLPAACESYVVMHWSDPDGAVAGTDCTFANNRGRIRPDGRLLLSSSTELREFHCDGCTQWFPPLSIPDGWLANDTLIDTPPCSGSFLDYRGFAVGVAGEVIHQCVSTWYDADGNELPLTPGPIEVLGLGYDHKALTGNRLVYSIVDIVDGTSTPVTGLPSGQILTSRVSGPDSFWVTYADPPVSYTVELWSISYDGVATRLGEFPPAPAGVTGTTGIGALRNSRLDANGRLFTIGFDNGDDLVLRRTIAGDVEVVYTEATNPSVRLHSAVLWTGP